VYVKLPDNVTAKDLIVDIQKTKLKIQVKGQEPIVDGLLHKPVKKGDCLWTLERDGEKRTLQLSLTK